MCLHFGLGLLSHDDVIKWKHFPCYWPFVREIHRSPLISPRKGQWRGALMFSLICAWINGWVNNYQDDDLRRHRAHYDVTVMEISIFKSMSRRIFKPVFWLTGNTSTNQSLFWVFKWNFGYHGLWSVLLTVLRWCGFHDYVTDFMYCGSSEHSTNFRCCSTPVLSLGHSFCRYDSCRITVTSHEHPQSPACSGWRKRKHQSFTWQGIFCVQCTSRVSQRARNTKGITATSKDHQDILIHMSLGCLFSSFLGLILKGITKAPYHSLAFGKWIH